MTSCPGLTTDQAVAKFNVCLGGTCDNLLSCIGMICPTASGTAGTSGAAGSTGAAGHGGTSGAGTAGTNGGAGSSGAAGFTGAAGFGFDGGFPGTAGTAGSTCDTACTKADSCCQAINAATNAGQSCKLKMSCDSANAGTDKMNAVSNCNLELQVSAALGASQPAACK